MRELEIFRHLDAVETIVNQHLIPFISNVVKALVTLVILATKGLIKLSYIMAIFVTNKFATVKNTKTTDVDREINVPVSISISEDSDNIVDSEIGEPQSELSQIINITEEIASIVESFNTLKPYIKPNYIERFVNNGLKDKLSESYLDLVSYQLPKNKRTRTKTHIRHESLGVLIDHYPVLIATGVLR